jgi:TatD DNase family protein
MFLVDSHCHLNFPDYKDDLDAVVARAREVGVRVMQTICTELEEFEEVRGIAEKYEGIYCSVGVHPNDVAKYQKATVAELIRRTQHPKVIGIGETGLDYHYENSPREVQQESFRIHIEAAQATGLPIIIHTRDAEEDTIDILSRALQKKPFTGVMHCFTGSLNLAKAALDMGFYISLSGILTFKKAEDLRAIAAFIPLEKLLIETDAPYLAPLPYRGKRNEPSYVLNTNRLLAEIKQIDEIKSGQVTSNNFFRLFNKAEKPSDI